MIQTISRPFNDDVSYDLFCDLLKECPYDYEAYYLWSSPPEKFKEFFRNTKFKSSNIVIGIKDLLDLWTDFNYWQDQQQTGIKFISDVVRRYPDKNFIIFTSLENLHLELIEPNVQIIPWGGDIVNQRSGYQHLAPVVEKNFNSTKTFISLNRNIRSHRAVLLSYLYGKGYNNFGNISYLGVGDSNPYYKPLAFLDLISWEFDDYHDSARTCMLDGYEKFYMNPDMAVDGFEIYGESRHNDNISNFNRSLRDKYKNSFVEIITESSYAAPSFMLTEKTHHSFYGFNFPILICGAGGVAHLRDVGFDMFDDIVDHSYDLISNPFDRIISAIDNNHRLLTDGKYAKECWKNNYRRFENNLLIAQDKMYSWYQNRTIAQFNKIRWQ